MPGKNPIRGTGGSAKTWSLQEIQELLDVLAGREITEFEMEQQGVKIRIKRGNSHAGTPLVLEGNYVSSPTASVHPPPPAPPATSSETAPQPGEPLAESTEDLYVMKSPIVGTFYASPAPNAPPFVEVGDQVQVGQVLCIIEAMKLMNELEAEVAGEVVRIYVENGQPVEYGQSLFALKPSHKK